MLKYLHIENIAVIEKSDIEFTEGFNVLTGETGAGKSIIIDAINAVLGERTSKDLIRSGCDYGEVSALFGNFSESALINLSSLDVLADNDGNILITRKLSLSGKGMIKVNGKPATAGDLREISTFLIDIHGQHDNQALLNSEKHCGFIDAVACNSELLDDYYNEFKKLNGIRKELQALEFDENEKQHKIELLKYQIKELEDADIKSGELADLKKMLAVAENFEQTQKSLLVSSNCLLGDDETDGAITLLKNSLKALLNVNSNESYVSKLNEIISIAEDLGADISNTLYENSELSLDVNEINHRLDLLQRLMLKYGNSEELMLEFLSNAKLELQNIEFSDKKAEMLLNELEKSKLKLIDKAKKLTESRVKASEIFQKEVCDVLSYLNMPDVRFAVDMKQGRYTKNGCDTLEFLISANAGENVKPLSKIASGGELSRTMLAIKSALLDNDSVSTMIFDEIDTGISGFAAEKVGTQLKKVSYDKQVICVTHLAQIAAKADNHLLIEKSVADGRTYTKVSVLQKEERINEIARIMSGGAVTSNLYNSAKELLDRS